MVADVKCIMEIVKSSILKSDWMFGRGMDLAKPRRNYKDFEELRRAVPLVMALTLNKRVITPL